MATGPVVIPLDRISDRTAALVGSKARTLGALMRYGLPVPEGFCIASAAYAQHIREHRLDGWIEDPLHGLSTADTDTRQQALSRIRAAIIHSPMAESLKEAIGKGYHALEPRFVAVRSSATAEDLPHHSFAGQYDSFLGIDSAEACLEAVKQCWASLWTERAYSYRARNGIDHCAMAMAVIVQRQVDPDLAGVVFTVDPVSGSPSRIVIESCPGLGEALVSGRVNPDRVVFRKQNLLLIRHTASTPAQEPAPGDAACQDPPPGPAASLDLAAARNLARKAKWLEKKLGCAQDIEWAVRKGRIYFLQARPVTVIPRAKDWEDRQVWSNLNTGEVFPDVTTPMTWSMIQFLLKPLFRSALRLAGADIDKAPVAGLVAGRIYFNLNTFVAVARPFQSASSKNPDSQILMGGQQDKMVELGLLDIPDEDCPDLGFAWPRYVLSWPQIIHDLYAHRPRRAALFQREVKAQGDRLLALDVTGMECGELARALVDTIQGCLPSWDLLYLAPPSLSVPVLDKACRSWLGLQDLTVTQRLFAAQGGMADTKAGLDLWRLAVLAHQDRDTEVLLLASRPSHDLQQELGQSAHGRRFLDTWDAFMTEHGHHCRGELELFNARWSETPDYMLGLVRGYIRSVDQADPLANQQRLAQERRHLTEQFRHRLRNPIKRRIFNWSLKTAQKVTQDRENWKNQAVRQVAGMRRILLALGDRLAQVGILVHRDDVFFLEFQEIEAVAAGQADFDVKRRVAERRVQYEQDRSVTPPPVVIGRFDPDRATTASVDSHAKVLKGIAASSGVVTGKARVILRTDDNQCVSPGEILVAPFTDPAWAPYFVTAAGVVMDQGGIISHGSIIAREYGLPAVVNVGHATQVIRTGQVIEVDGNSGQVTLMEAE